MSIPVKAISRLGTETAFAVLARSKELEQQGKKIFNFGIGQPDFAPPPHVLQAAAKAIRDGHHGYTPAQGIPELRLAASEYLEKRSGSSPLDPERVLIVPGGKITMFFTHLLLAEPGVEICYPDPGFPIYRSLIDYAGAKAVAYHTVINGKTHMSAEAILSKVTQRTRLLILNSPCNPTGGILSQEETDKLAQGLQNFPNLYILSDEIYHQLLYNGAQHKSLLSFPSLRDRVILLDGMSKSYAMTGWRLGYSYWPKDLIEPAVRLAVNSYSCVNAITQWAGLAALRGPQNAVGDMRDIFEQRRDVLVKGLNDIPGIRCDTPQGAFYAFPDISDLEISSKDLERHMLENAGIACIAGTSFGERGEGHLRFSFATNLPAIKQGLAKLKDYIETL